MTASESMASGFSRMNPFSLARLTVGGEGSGCKPDLKRRQQIVKLRRRGFTFKRIAEHLGMQYQGVQRMAKTSSINEHVALLHGPYVPPTLRRGDRTICLYRDADVVITTWSDGRISWPRCRQVGVKGGNGLLVTDELVRAIRVESSLALQHWFGAGIVTIWRWRKAFGVTQWGTEGSRQLLEQSSKAGADKSRGKKLPADQVERRRQSAKTLDLGRYLQPGHHGPWWTAKQLALLGELPDAEVAARIGRTPNAVRIMRTELGIASALDRRVAAAKK
jgi:hypothetical protein